MPVNVPDPNDGILDNVVDIPTDNSSSSSEGDSTMATQVPSALHEQNLGRLASAGASAHEHFVQFGKILDLSYEQDRKMVSLTESLGVREVTSKSGQLGVPFAGTSSGNG